MLDIRARLKAALTEEPELVVIINAEAEVRQSAVVNVMDELRSSGISHLAIAVKPATKFE